MRSNLNIRAQGASADEKRAGGEAFATSAIALFQIESETAASIAVNATTFFLSGTYDVAEMIGPWQQGAARIDVSRRRTDGERTKAFPENTEIHAVLTYAVDNAGATLRHSVPVEFVMSQSVLRFHWPQARYSR